MAEHIFTGFGFGPIQSGLFAKEAFESGNFARIVVAEIDSQLVDAVKANNGCYSVNVARCGEGILPLLDTESETLSGRKGGTPSPHKGIETLKIDNVELLNPNVEADRQVLLEVLAESTEIVTCLPSVSFYDAGGTSSVVSLIAAGLENSRAQATVIYTAENNNHAAEILEKAVVQRTGDLPQRNAQFLNTV
ncbi:MAG: hypothetical protein U9Q07_14980, partial [Planctomycetota bacterium]|nr:hypothetical protein [Planctomycetota bacterium]